MIPDGTYYVSFLAEEFRKLETNKNFYSELTPDEIESMLSGTGADIINGDIVTIKTGVPIRYPITSGTSFA